MISSSRLSPATNRFEAALAEAKRWRMEAMTQAGVDVEALEAVSPAPLPGNERDAWWRQSIAQDRGGELRRALAAARRAAALARTPREVARATLLRSVLECYAGRHVEELHLARRLVELEPHADYSLQALRRASACCGLDEAIPSGMTSDE